MQFDLPANSNDILRNASLPFMIEKSGIRGRFVRINEEVHKILSDHKYPLRVSQLLGELLVLVSMVGTMMKLKGIISIQAQGNGAISFVSADYTSDGHLRGYTHVNDKKTMRDIEATGRKEQDITELFGNGNVMITIDNKGERAYQAIVPLTGKSLSGCIVEYFRQSDQLDVVMEVTANKINKTWHAGGIVLQRIAQEGGRKPSNRNEDDFERASILLDSVTDKELIDDNLPMPTLLYRLFHEDGVRIFDPSKLEARCRCSRERMEMALDMMPEYEREKMKVKGVITITCRFCNKKEKFK
ncbi:MAG: Hsp33 family molecular chaperone [Alphaproteobacteria bacterium CG11_big_fil_rev_8_21_14_0_20_39_49]|nr:MAG: Hsp33 family molecular chaperone [Alphaproteobacteria bacterium CG11_big_fil_rev_8_21_14_0_20_39_49]